MKLLRYRRPVGSIFDLLGTNEDDMTYALGSVASRSSEFASRSIRAVDGPKGGIVRLQEIDREGRTDVEIEWPERFIDRDRKKLPLRVPSVPCNESTLTLVLTALWFSSHRMPTTGRPLRPPDPELFEHARANRGIQ